MQIEGCCNNHTLHTLIVQQTAIIIILLSLGVILCCILKVRAVVIAQGHHLDIGHLQQMLDVKQAARTGTDDTYAGTLATDLLLRLLGARLQPREERQRHTCKAHP